MDKTVASNTSLIQRKEFPARRRRAGIFLFRITKNCPCDSLGSTSLPFFLFSPPALRQRGAESGNNGTKGYKMEAQGRQWEHHGWQHVNFIQGFPHFSCVHENNAKTTKMMPLAHQNGRCGSRTRAKGRTKGACGGLSELTVYELAVPVNCQ